jgi:hypothetical protein
VKPQPHQSAMAKDDERAKAPDPKEAKLAEALRANLRRRKAAGRAAAPSSDKPSTS